MEKLVRRDFAASRQNDPADDPRVRTARAVHVSANRLSANVYFFRELPDTRVRVAQIFGKRADETPRAAPNFRRFYLRERVYMISKPPAKMKPFPALPMVGKPIVKRPLFLNAAIYDGEKLDCAWAVRPDLVQAQTGAFGKANFDRVHFLAKDEVNHAATLSSGEGKSVVVRASPLVMASSSSFG
jgi:hypothetical protein